MRRLEAAWWRKRRQSKGGSGVDDEERIDAIPRGNVNVSSSSFFFFSSASFFFFFALLCPCFCAFVRLADVAVVPPSGGEGEAADRGHVVADGDRCLPRRPPPRYVSVKDRKGRRGRLWNCGQAPTLPYSTCSTPLPRSRSSPSPLVVEFVLRSGCTPLKPGCATRPFFGVEPEVLHKDGAVADTDEAGYLTIKKPWPGMMRTVYGDHERFLRVRAHGRHKGGTETGWEEKKRGWRGS